MKKYIASTMITIFLLAVLWLVRTKAEEAEGLRIDDKGQVTLVSSYAAEEGICSMSFGLYVDAAAGDRIGFRFNESNGRIREFRYDEENHKLNIYIAGTEALMKNGGGPLVIGSIEVLDGNGSAAAATVSVAAGSLNYVDGTELKWMGELEPQEAVQINPSGGGPAVPTPAPQPTPAPTPQPTSAPTPQPTSAPTPAPTDEPPSVPGQEDPGHSGTVGPTAAPTAAPTPQPTKVPQTAPTSVPVTPMPSSQPAATAAPSPAPQQTEPQETSDASEESGGESIAVSGTGESEEPSEEGSAGGLDWVLVIAIAAMVLFVVVAVMAVVVLKKKPKADSFDDDQ